jgi:hypothetical protein
MRNGIGEMLGDGIGEMLGDGSIGSVVCCFMSNGDTGSLAGRLFRGDFFARLGVDAAMPWLTALLAEK